MSIGTIRIVVVLVCFSAFAAGQESGPLRGLADLNDAVSRRASSADRSGGNADWVEVKAKSTATLAEIKGAGSIRHIWFTINSPSPFHLRELVLRMYWDGETEPSVEVPIGDFFGTGFEYEDVPGGHRGQKYQSWVSLPITVQDRAMNCYFEMPFGNGARITLTNDGTQDVPNLYFHVDYQEYRDAQRVADQGRFHAQWRHEQTRAIPESESAGKNVDGKNNYLFMEARGKGQYVGTILNVFGLSTGWWGEGDDMFFVDGEMSRATINGTRHGRLFQQRVDVPEGVQLPVYRLFATGQLGTGPAATPCTGFHVLRTRFTFRNLPPRNHRTRTTPTTARTTTPA